MKAQKYMFAIVVLFQEIVIQFVGSSNVFSWKDFGYCSTYVRFTRIPGNPYLATFMENILLESSKNEIPTVVAKSGVRNYNRKFNLGTISPNSKIYRGGKFIYFLTTNAQVIDLDVFYKSDDKHNRDNIHFWITQTGSEWKQPDKLNQYLTEAYRRIHQQMFGILFQITVGGPTMQNVEFQIYSLPLGRFISFPILDQNLSGASFAPMTKLAPNWEKVNTDFLGKILVIGGISPHCTEKENNRCSYFVNPVMRDLVRHYNFSVLPKDHPVAEGAINNHIDTFGGLVMGMHLNMLGFLGDFGDIHVAAVVEDPPLTNLYCELGFDMSSATNILEMLSPFDMYIWISIIAWFGASMLMYPKMSISAVIFRWFCFIMRQGVNRVTLLCVVWSMSGFLLSTFYECFISSTTVAPLGNHVLPNLEAVLRTGRKIMLHDTQNEAFVKSCGYASLKEYHLEHANTLVSRNLKRGTLNGNTLYRYVQVISKQPVMLMRQNKTFAIEAIVVTKTSQVDYVLNMLRLENPDLNCYHTTEISEYRDNYYYKTVFHQSVRMDKRIVRFHEVGIPNLEENIMRFASARQMHSFITRALKGKKVMNVHFSKHETKAVTVDTKIMLPFVLLVILVVICIIILVLEFISHWSSAYCFFLQMASKPAKNSGIVCKPKKPYHERLF